MLGSSNPEAMNRLLILLVILLGLAILVMTLQRSGSRQDEGAEVFGATANQFACKEGMLTRAVTIEERQVYVQVLPARKCSYGSSGKYGF